MKKEHKNKLEETIKIERGQKNESENKERKFKRTKQKLVNFLNTPFEEYISKNNVLKTANIQMAKTKLGGIELAYHSWYTQLKEQLESSYEELMDIDKEKAEETILKLIEQNLKNPSPIFHDNWNYREYLEDNFESDDYDSWRSLATYEHPEINVITAFTNTIERADYYSDEIAKKIFDIQFQNIHKEEEHGTWKLNTEELLLATPFDIRRISEVMAHHEASKELLDYVLEKILSQENTNAGLNVYLDQALGFQELDEEWEGEDENEEYDLPTYYEGIIDYDVNLSAKHLLEALNNTDNKERKSIISDILHRLEFGRIGISEEGVKYLEKTYDLGEYNKPDYHVSRLTADGEIGVFSEDKELIKYFQLGDLSSPEKKVRAKVLDFVYETLFIGQENETKEEKAERLQYLEEFKKHYYEIAEDEMFKGTGVKLNNLSFQEQGWFVMYFNREQNPEKKEELVEVVKNFGENGLRVFFSMEFGGQEMGEHILALAHNLPKEAAQAVFDKYSDLVNTANQAVEYVADKFSKEKIDEAATQKIRINLLRRAKNILAEQSEMIDVNDENEKIKLTGKIIKKLNNVREDIILFAETYHASGLPIEEMPDTEFGNFTPEELTDQDKEQMIKNAEMNVNNKKFGETVVIPSLKESFKNPDNRFHLIKHNGNVISSLRLEDRGKDYYFGSFYADPNAQGAGLGQEMMERVVAEAAKEKPVVASAVADQAPIRNYINKQGFVATKIMPAYENTGVDLFEIRLDKKSPIKAVRDTTPETITFDLKNNRAGFVAECKKRLNSGEFIMTKYEADNKTGKATCEFQKAVLSDEMALQKARRQVEEAA